MVETSISRILWYVNMIECTVSVTDRLRIQRNYYYVNQVISAYAILFE